MKFKCQKCGKCCTDLNPGIKLNYPIPGFASDTVIALTQPNLMILPWEKHLFPQKVLTPHFVMFDRLNNLVIILNYALTTNSCPNLKAKQCSIYNKRLIHCQSYPCPYSCGDELDQYEGHFASEFCPSELSTDDLKKFLDKDQVSPKTLQQKLYKRYDNIFIYKLMWWCYYRLSQTTIQASIKNKYLKPAKKGDNLTQLLAQIKTAKKIDIHDYIKEEFDIDITEVFDKKAFQQTREFLKKECDGSD
ncbi:hypothetical protein ACFL0V_00385 [Nanoarchaeota archaeon]